MRATLATGDYSVRGLEHKVALERKSLSDLVMCVGRERERFEKELQRLMAYETRAVIVEADWAHIELKQYRGLVEPNMVLGSLMGWVAQGVPLIMCGDAQRAGKFIARLLFTAARRHWASVYPFLAEVSGETELEPLDKIS
jgi:DNA excision repair protein ERCC-4